MVNDTTRLLGLDGPVAERVELDAAGVPVVDLSTGYEQARCCPQCGYRAVRVKQWTTTRPRDLPVPAGRCGGCGGVNGAGTARPQPVRVGRSPSTSPRHHDRDLVAEHQRVPDHRDHQRRLRRNQPRHQDRRPRRLRLPQPRKPTATHPHRDHPTPPRTPQPRPTSKSRHRARARPGRRGLPGDG